MGNPPPGKSGHMHLGELRAMIAILVPQLAFGLSSVWVVLAPYALRQSGWSPLTIKAIYALPSLSSAVTFLFQGYLTAKFTPRRLCWSGVSLLMANFSPQFWKSGSASWSTMQNFDESSTATIRLESRFLSKLI